MFIPITCWFQDKTPVSNYKKYQPKKKVQDCLKGMKHQSALPTEKEMVGT